MKTDSLPDHDAVNAKLWTAVDNYICDRLVTPDPILDAALEASAKAGLPTIQVAPNQGKLLQLLAKLQGAREILEIGTLGGYSTIWLARALPAGGRLVTLEAEPKHAEVARANIARANLAGAVELRLGPALASLEKLAAEKRGAFDLIFIDADKERTPDYFTWALKLAQVGSLIIVDNVVRKGGLADASSQDPGVKAAQRLHDMLKTEPRVSATTLQMVGSKGHDGWTLALVIE